MHIISKLFVDLTPIELYKLLQLRSEVFVVEQNCVYQDIDNKDLGAYHLMGYLDMKLVAYARVLAKGVSYKQHASIGRVVILQEARGTALGKKIMQKAIEICKQEFGTPIKISAQAHLENFYVNLGFEKEGEPYLEDNIPHVAMTMQ